MRLHRLWLLTLLTAAGEAWACLPQPLDMRVDFFNDALDQLLTGQGVLLTKVTSAAFAEPRVVRYEWIRTDPRFECHDKETLAVGVKALYQDVAEGRTCIVEGTVTKTEGFYEGTPKSTYVLTGVVDSCRD